MRFIIVLVGLVTGLTTGCDANGATPTPQWIPQAVIATPDDGEVYPTLVVQAIRRYDQVLDQWSVNAIAWMSFPDRASLEARLQQGPVTLKLGEQVFSTPGVPESDGRKLSFFIGSSAFAAQFVDSQGVIEPVLRLDGIEVGTFLYDRSDPMRVDPVSLVECTTESRDWTPAVTWNGRSDRQVRVLLDVYDSDGDSMIEVSDTGTYSVPEGTLALRPVPNAQMVTPMVLRSGRRTAIVPTPSLGKLSVVFDLHSYAVGEPQVLLGCNPSHWTTP